MALGEFSPCNNSNIAEINLACAARDSLNPFH